VDPWSARSISFDRAAFVGYLRRHSTARDVPDTACAKLQAHAGLALGYERMIGTGVLGDDDLLKRSSVVLEQTDDGGE
jgi:hypothetical protein